MLIIFMYGPVSWFVFDPNALCAVRLPLARPGKGGGGGGGVWKAWVAGTVVVRHLRRVGGIA